MIFYVLLRGVENFFNEYNRYPGANNDMDVDSEVTLLKKIVNKLLNDYRIPVAIKDEYISEM